MTVWTDLKQARQRARLSAEQISGLTKIQLYRVKALENGDYAQLPQGIYLDGIVRAYAREVGIDPEPLVKRVRLERGKLPGDQELPFAVPIDLHLPRHRSDDSGLEGFTSEGDFAATPPAAVTFIPVESPRILPRPPQEHHHGGPPPQRSVRVLLHVLALLAGVGLGMYVYASKSPERDATVASQPSASGDARNATTSAAPEGGRIDHAEKPSDQVASVVPRVTSGISDTLSPATHPASRPRAAAAPSRSAQTRAERITTPGSSPDVTGAWRLATHVESSSYARFTDLQLGYNLTLEQDGERVTGAGRKVTENGNGIGRSAQTAVTVSGMIEGDRLMLNFVERGTRRPTQGKFILMVEENGILRGRFSSEAAKSSGRVEAHRLTAQ